MKRFSSAFSATTFFVAAATVSTFSSSATADIFGSGANSFEIEFVTVGNPGNPPDTTDRPVTVAYQYRIATYEISEEMIAKTNALGGLGITMDSRGPDFPATSVTWYEAARFVNWLNTSTGSMPAYKFDAAGNFQLWNEMDAGFDPANPYRNRLAFYFLPSLNEWHKAAYYDPVAGVYYDYPTGSDMVPDGIDFAGDPNFDAVFFDGGGTESQPNQIFNAGLLSPYGTAAQGGNVREFQETAFDRLNNEAGEHRRAAGGSMNDTSNVMAAFNSAEGRAPLAESPIVGFRVATVVPEPTTSLLLGMAVISSLGLRNRLARTR